MGKQNMEDLIRAAAFQWIRSQMLKFGGSLPWTLLLNGFAFQEQRVALVGPAGIWKPKQFSSIPISITSTHGGRYQDAPNAEGLILYSYRDTGPDHRDNVGLREAMRTRTPLVYFFGVGSGYYLPVLPVIIIEDDRNRQLFTVAIDPAYTVGENSAQEEQGLIVQDTTSLLSVRRYVAAYTMQRLHQASFREAVIRAYSESCTLCRLRHRELLDAAHIIGDKEDRGDPIVPNGLCLCKIHHAAFDQNFLGITPEYVVQVRPDILKETDGPMLMHGLQQLHNRTLILPRKRTDRPDPERLAVRYSSFREAV